MIEWIFFTDEVLQNAADARQWWWMFSGLASKPIRSFDVIMFNMIRRHFLKKKLDFIILHTTWLALALHNTHTTLSMQMHIHTDTQTCSHTFWIGPSAG